MVALRGVTAVAELNEVAAAKACCEDDIASRGNRSGVGGETKVALVSSGAVTELSVVVFVRVIVGGVGPAEEVDVPEGGFGGDAAVVIAARGVTTVTELNKTEATVWADRGVAGGACSEEIDVASRGDDRNITGVCPVRIGEEIGVTVDCIGGVTAVAEHGVIAAVFVAAIVKLAIGEEVNRPSGGDRDGSTQAARCAIETRPRVGAAVAELGRSRPRCCQLGR